MNKVNNLRLPYNSLSLPYHCHLCGTSSVHQICLPCEELFKRGLKTSLFITKTFKNMDIHSMKYELGKWLTREKTLPRSILMNQPTYYEYCMTNRNLPSTPPFTKGDSLHHVNGIPIDIVDYKTFGYIFSDVSMRL